MWAWFVTASTESTIPMENDPSDLGGSDGDIDVEQLSFEWTAGEPPSVAVVEAIAAATGRDPTGVGPIYESVDTDALDALVSGGTPDAGSAVHVSFTHEGVQVTVDSRGGIEVHRFTAGIE